MKNKKISLVAYIIGLIVLAIIVGVLIFFILQGNNQKTDLPIIPTNNNKAENTNLSNDNTTTQAQTEIGDYFILYNGYEMQPKVGIQNLVDMKINDSNNKKYNTKYYNYEDGKYVGESEGTFGEETYEGVSVVSGVKKIAISEKYDAIPRNYFIIKELPEKLMNLADSATVTIHTIDLDGDGEQEYVVCCKVDFGKNEIGDGDPQASSAIILFDSNYNKITNLVNLQNGFWANIKEEDRKVFLSLDDVSYIDIDNDGIMEIIIKIPTYEGTKISVVKYNKGNITGEVDIEASVQP